MNFCRPTIPVAIFLFINFHVFSQVGSKQKLGLFTYVQPALSHTLDTAKTYLFNYVSHNEYRKRDLNMPRFKLPKHKRTNNEYDFDFFIEIEEQQGSIIDQRLKTRTTKVKNTKNPDSTITRYFYKAKISVSYIMVVKDQHFNTILSERVEVSTRYSSSKHLTEKEALKSFECTTPPFASLHYDAVYELKRIFLDAFTERRKTTKLKIYKNRWSYDEFLSAGYLNLKLGYKELKKKNKTESQDYLEQSIFYYKKFLAKMNTLKLKPRVRKKLRYHINFNLAQAYFLLQDFTLMNEHMVEAFSVKTFFSSYDKKVSEIADKCASRIDFVAELRKPNE